MLERCLEIDHDSVLISHDSLNIIHEDDDLISFRAV
jgi:hypothetical protein